MLDPQERKAVATPHIGLSYAEDLQSSALDDFCQEIAASGLDFRSETRPSPGPFMGVEWLMPTAIIVYLSKSYFDAFLKEAGKEHYQALKKGLAKLAARFTGPKAPTTRLYFSDGKVKSPMPEYSLVFSVLADLGDGITVKLLLQPSFSADQSNSAVTAFLHFLDSVHNGTFDPNSIKGLVNARPVGRTLLLAFNPETSALEVIDPLPKAVRERI
jgi:hypothetical protein